jgi:hypothetical protein
MTDTTLPAWWHRLSRLAKRLRTRLILSVNGSHDTNGLSWENGALVGTIQWQTRVCAVPDYQISHLNSPSRCRGALLHEIGHIAGNAGAPGAPEFGSAMFALERRMAVHMGWLGEWEWWQDDVPLNSYETEDWRGRYTQLSPVYWRGLSSRWQRWLLRESFYSGVWGQEEGLFLPTGHIAKRVPIFDGQKDPFQE